ncbi:MAG: universal stress protein [Halohasta sp.]
MSTADRGTREATDEPGERSGAGVADAFERVTRDRLAWMWKDPSACINYHSPMRTRLREWYRAGQRRLRSVERRELRALRRWLEHPQNLLHLSALVFVPLLIGAVTWLANASPIVSFLIYPPLASGTYTLFSNPEGRYSSPATFVGGLSLGAFIGWLVLELSVRYWSAAPLDPLEVPAGAAALAVLLTGVSTWALSLEEPSAFSSALLVLVTGADQVAFVGGVFVSSLLVAGVFVLWRDRLYEERARYLFHSMQADDQILVPIRSDDPESLVLLAARLAAAHDDGRLVLVQTVSTDTIERTASEVAADVAPEDARAESTDEDATKVAEAKLTDHHRQRLERLRDLVDEAVGVPCEFAVVAEGGSPGEAILETAALEDCDLIVAPYESTDGEPGQFVRTILKGSTDTVVYRPSTGRIEWDHVLVMVRGAGETANMMLDFAHRLVEGAESVSACTCIPKPEDRRKTEVMLDNLVESFPDPIETRISNNTVESFLETNAENYDLTVLGASTDRSAVSRFVSTPTFERLDDVDCDLAIVHRG